MTSFKSLKKYVKTRNVELGLPDTFVRFVISLTMTIRRNRSSIVKDVVFAELVAGKISSTAITANAAYHSIS